jgi:spermidine synthase
VASLPEVKELVSVEINPGYLQIVSRYDEVKSILNNPKVKIVIDDGRRWMMRHPDEQFDVIMQNTTWHFIANATHLLSREYLALSKAHLKTGGFLYFNTTASVDVMKTATDVFAHVLRVQNLIAASDEPVRFDKARWRESIKRGLDEDTPRFAALMRFADSAGEPPTAWTLEEEAHLLPRISHGATVTDDNMLIEWKWWSDRWLFGY